MYDEYVLVVFRNPCSSSLTLEYVRLAELGRTSQFTLNSSVVSFNSPPSSRPLIIIIKYILLILNMKNNMTWPCMRSEVKPATLSNYDPSK